MCPRNPDWFVPLVAAAAMALPAAAQEVTLEGPPFLGADGDAAVDAAHAMVRQDREGFEQPDEMPDLSGDAARRRAAAAHPAGDGRRRRHRVDASRLHGGPLSDDGSVRAAVHVAQRRGDEPGGVGLLHAVRIQGIPGIKALAVNVHDNGYIHTVNKQIKVMADFKGLKMRAPTRQTNKLLGALGATPVAMPLPALGDALSKGVVDGVRCCRGK